MSKNAAHRRRLQSGRLDVNNIPKYVNSAVIAYCNEQQQRKDAAKLKHTKANIPFSEVHITYPDAFRTSSGIATRISHDNFDLSAKDVYFTTTIDQFIQRHLAHAGAYTNGPVAAVVPGDLENLRTYDNDNRNGAICERYRPLQINLAVSNTSQHIPHDTKAILLQFGQHDISYRPVFNIVDRPPLEYETLSVRIIKSKFSQATWDKIQTTSGFSDHMISTFGRQCLYPHASPHRTMTKMVQHRGLTTLHQYGYVHIHTGLVKEALSKSSPKKGVLVYYSKKDDQHTIYKIPKTGNEDDATNMAERLGDIARGIVTTSQGYAIRVRAEDLPKAHAIASPDFVAAVGEELMRIHPRDTKHNYILKGVPSDISLLHACQIVKAALGITIKPVRYLRTNERDTNNIHFISSGPPARTTFQLRGTNKHITIVPHVNNQSRNRWEAGFTKHDPHSSKPDNMQHDAHMYQEVSDDEDAEFHIGLDSASYDSGPTSIQEP